MSKTNYSFEKRQRELAKKKKQEEKRQRKASRVDAAASGPDSAPRLERAAVSDRADADVVSAALAPSPVEKPKPS